MTLIQEEKFKRKDFEKSRDIVKVSLNKVERQFLDECKYDIKQLKDSTAIKQLMSIGANVVQDKKIQEITNIIINNQRKNKRLGIHDFD